MRQIKEKDKVWGKQGRALGCTLRLQVRVRVRVAKALW